MRMTIVHLLIAEHIRIALCAFVGVSICQTEHCFLAYCNSEIASHACLFNLMLFRGPLVSLSSFLFFFFPSHHIYHFISLIYYLSYLLLFCTHCQQTSKRKSCTSNRFTWNCLLSFEEGKKKKSSKWSNTILSI